MFLGIIEGSTSPVSRIGGKKSGLHTVAAGTQGSCHVRLSLDQDSEIERCTVTLEPWKGEGHTVLLYDGPVRGRSGGRDSVKRDLLKRIISEHLQVSGDIVTQLTDAIITVL